MIKTAFFGFALWFAYKFGKFMGDAEATSKKESAGSNLKLRTLEEENKELKEALKKKESGNES